MATFTYSTPNSPRTRTVVLVVHKTSRVVNYIPKSDGQYEGSGEGSSVMSYALANRSDFRMNILSPGIFFLGRQHRIIWSEVLSLTNTMALSTPEDRLLSLSPFMALSTRLNIHLASPNPNPLKKTRVPLPSHEGDLHASFPPLCHSFLSDPTARADALR